MPRLRYHRAASALLILGALGQSGSEARAIADPTADGGAGLTATSRELQLEVIINGASTRLIGSFRQLPDGGIAAAPAETRAVGLRPTDDAVGPDGLVHLDRLRGIHIRLDEVEQRLYVTAGDAARMPNVVDLNPRQVRDMPQPLTSYGSVLNYTLFASSDNSFFSYPTRFNGVAGAFDGRIFSPLGTLSQSFQANSALSDLGLVRLDTQWTYSDPNTLTTYRVGDTISGGLNWTRPVRLGGIQVQRNFALRPDLVTIPIPVLSGSAAVPSTIDVYTQNVKTYTGAIPAGPYEVTHMPIASGAGVAQVVLHDSLGRETVTSLPFYISGKLLAEGLYDFSAETGFARRLAGVESNNYDSRLMGSGSIRYGARSWLTLEGHFEGGAGLVNGGAGAVMSLGPFGAVSAAIAGSGVEGLRGALYNISIETGFRGYSLYARTERTLYDYRDIASITADCTAPIGALCAPPGSATQGNLPGVPLGAVPFATVLPPKAVSQIGLGVPLPADASSLNVTYTQLTTALGDNTRVIGFSYSRSVPYGGTAFVSAFRTLDHGGLGLFAGLSFPLGGNITVSTGVERANDGTRFVSSAVKTEEHQEGSYGWRVRDAEGATADRYAAASYRSPWGRIEGSVQQYGSATRGTAQVDGAIAAAGGGVFFTNRIDDSFAVVDAGAPGVEVQHENRPVGRTDSQGKLLVPYLNSYDRNKLSIDPKNLPVDADITTTNEIVVPADRNGVVVNFGVASAPRAALVGFVDAAGKPLRVGLEGHLDADGSAFVVGYDGQAYIRGLAPRNAVTIDLAGEGSCRAEFQYVPQRGAQTVIGGVQCR